MAQGQILSCLIRAYDITNDIKYLESGYKALQFMISPGDEDIFNGCSKKLYDLCKNSNELKEYVNYRIFEEYVSQPSSYVLNGDLMALIGLYDWWQGAPVMYGKDDAKLAFEDGVKSVEIILPYYDYYGWSSYDLVQYTYDSRPFFTSAYAFDCHICFFNAIWYISHSEIIKKYRDIFLSYNNDDFWRQTSVLFKEN